MESNRVSVKIYGQEYVISGEKTREQIVQIGAYVDNKMHEIANVTPSGSVSDLAVLAAVNIADEHFDQEGAVDELKKLNQQLEKDAQHYVQLWDESKKAYAQYKDENQQSSQQKDDLMLQLNEKDRQLNELKEQHKRAEDELKRNAEAAINKAEARCKELENSFFDLQMENLQLKKTADAHKQNTE